MMYGDDSDEEEDILGPIIDEFSIKADVNLQNFVIQPPQTAIKAAQMAKQAAKKKGQAHAAAVAAEK